jgi:hypothetical protein
MHRVEALCFSARELEPPHRPNVKTGPIDTLHDVTGVM